MVYITPYYMICYAIQRQVFKHGTFCIYPYETFFGNILKRLCLTAIYLTITQIVCIKSPILFYELKYISTSLPLNICITSFYLYHSPLF